MNRFAPRITARFRLAWMLAACGAGVAVLPACQSVPTRSYVLYTVAPRTGDRAEPPLAAVSADAFPQVRVDAVHVPPAFDRVEVVTQLSRGELKINDLDHWSASLPQMARQTLSADLALRLPPGAVVAPHLSKPERALGINVDIQEFSVQPDGASLYVSYTISPSGGGSSGGVAKRGDGALHTASGGTSPAATAAALSELLGALADNIAAVLAAPP